MSFESSRLVIKHLAKELRDHPKLSLCAIDVLMECLHHEEGIDGVALVEELGMPKSTLWRTLAFFTGYREGGKMKGMGWLERTEIPENRRSVLIKPTEKGLVLKRKLEELSHTP